MCVKPASAKDGMVGGRVERKAKENSEGVVRPNKQKKK
jgi:hypothetical protein